MADPEKPASSANALHVSHLRSYRLLAGGRLIALEFAPEGTDDVA